MLWETADANANCILMTMPEGGTVDVPVFVIGDSTCFNKDLGWFNGSTQPNIALIDDDADSWAMFGHSTDDNPYIQYGGQANAFGVKGDFIIDSTLTLKGQVNPNTAQLVSFGTAVLPFNLYYGDSLDVNYADVGDLATANTIGGAYIYRVGGTDIAFSDGGLGFSTALQGDLLYWSNYDTPAKLGWTSTASYLKSGADSSISWDALTSDDLGDLASIAMLDEDETITGNWVNTTNPWAYNEGGTGTGTYLQGDILYASDYNALSRLGWSLEGKLLTQLADSGIGYTTATYPATILQGDILIASNFSTISNYPWPGIGYYLVSGADSSWTTNPLLKDLTVSGTGMSGGADDILLGADADVTITLTTSKDAVAGDGLGGGEDNVFPGADADVTFAVLLDTDGGLETTDDSVNIKLDGTTLTVSSSGLKVTDNTFQPLEAILTDIADGTILENLVNTANPWADNEIASSATWNARLDSAIIVVWGDTNSHIATYTYVVNNATQDGDTASWLATKTWVPANSQADGDTSTWDATKTDLIEKISSTALDTKSEFNTQCGDGDFVFGGDSPSLAIVTITGALKHSVTAGITAVNPGAQGDGTLTTEVNEVATVANASDAVTLPAATPGLEIFIINNGANILEIWPGTDDNLGAGVNNATTLASGFNITFVAYDATNWEVK
jgi:hypothetical protein